MLTSLSIFSLDQGPKWREPGDTSALEEPKAPEVAPGRRLEVLRAVGAGSPCSSHGMCPRGVALER